MKIVIPMSGMGDRFRRAGYREPKPLIKVDGRPMIEHIIEMFPGEDNFVFVCNSEHLRTSPLADVLTRAKPGGVIVEIEPHKLGPVHAVCQALDCLDDEEEVIVNYCDFGVAWDHRRFLAELRSRRAAGGISAYRGFHPHSLGPTYYAYVKHEGNWLVEIREKEAFTGNRMNEYASAGTYYFARGELVKRYFPMAMKERLEVSGEYYVSLVYNLLQRDGHRTYIYELERFLQWGTPQDLEEYQCWSDYFRGDGPRLGAANETPMADYNLVLMAGRGMRFAHEGYCLPKPLIPVAGAPMVIQAIRSLPRARRWGFIGLREHFEAYGVAELLRGEVGGCDLLCLDGVTEGQACTALFGERLVNPERSLLIAACDNGMTWDGATYRRMVADPSIDAIVWTFRRRASLEQNPTAFGWVDATSGQVTRVSVKIPISSTPRTDHAIVGTFYFRKSRDFFAAVRAMIEADRRVNGEFYIDEALNAVLAAGKTVTVFEVAMYLGWGTPDDLRTFEYWRQHSERRGVPSSDA
ncbi:MAG: NTP transferase domain-containing protein [Candidatus Rokubacteria bacterium]|nr:NTP transferase domain-containing protein [Candidatus Rokubacteria bacterium]